MNKYYPQFGYIYESQYENHSPIFTVDELNNKVSMHKTIDFELKRVTLDEILEKSRDFAVERQLKNRLNDINFIFPIESELLFSAGETLSFIILAKV